MLFRSESLLTVYRCAPSTFSYKELLEQRYPVKTPLCRGRAQSGGGLSECERYPSPLAFLLDGELNAWFMLEFVVGENPIDLPPIDLYKIL